MNRDGYIASLVQYGIDRGLIEPCDKTYAVNQLLQCLRLDSCEYAEPACTDLEEILKGLLEDVVSRGVCQDDITSRDLFDTMLMGTLTPRPHEVRQRFDALYREAPQAATDWFYRFSQDTDYIRRYRIRKDIHWLAETEYGTLDITINLSKPEKDPKAIAAAAAAPASSYPKCLLCVENEGYAGRVNHPARQNHRLIPITMDGEDWYIQYSPYVYYNEHCIVFNGKHSPMTINRGTFVKLLDFVTHFPHYFIGSNADLPIVGGSILSHEHFQGGRQDFAMAKAPVEKEIVFKGYEQVRAGIVKWPMSVIRLSADRKEDLVDLAEKILRVWRGYTDENAFVFAHTEGTPHNTITPIARRSGEAYELDLVLRNNITTKEHPLGVFHPHSELHHIKKENIGLIEVMGLAVLPARLKNELQRLEEAVVNGRALEGDLEKHGDWIRRISAGQVLTGENIHLVLQAEVGKVFARVLEHAGVFKRTQEGSEAFGRFVARVNAED
ncbi:MAG: UDP-glucose--hexose-1-phosphate uridylyltransferase [Clostridia bacterium]|nr:UDP-glucose--hexose-1-phosphate uridylyltransferase [Clostridia bacterium]